MITITGKWGTAQGSVAQYPVGRGFDYALTYQSFDNDYWTYQMTDPMYGYCNSSVTGVGPYANFNPYDLWENTGPAFRFKPADSCSSLSQAGCVYEDDLFVAEALTYMRNYKKKTPLALTLSFHTVHTPLTPPTAQLNKFSFINDTARQGYAAMVNMMDNYIGLVVDELKLNGMYDNTLILMFSDNGGPIYVNAPAGPPGKIHNVTGGANNYPLTGGKFGNFEGGIRVNAFVSGGFIPKNRRGTVETSLIGIEDWYATFCALAGVDPTDTLAASANLPPIDSINMWPLLSGATAEASRKEVRNTYSDV